METKFTYWETFLKMFKQFELSILKILSVYYFLCGLYPWIMLLVLTLSSPVGVGALNDPPSGFFVHNSKTVLC